MIRYTILIIGIATLSACGQQHQPNYDVGPFDTYVQEFQTEARAQGQNIQIKDLVMRFGDLSDTTEAGNCDMVEGETPVITINSQDWGAMDEGKRTALVFHELGHCILRRVHRPGVNGEGIPVSVMDPYTLDGSVFKSYESYYVQELFATENQF